MGGRSHSAADLKPHQAGGGASCSGELPVQVLRGTVLALMRQGGTDLTVRQLGVLLTVGLGDGPHTVRGLAVELDISKSAVTRALDRLGKLGLVRRREDTRDRRSVLAVPTPKGLAFLAALDRPIAEGNGASGAGSRERSARRGLMRTAGA